MNLKISIITVSYNAAKTIEQTILSVVNQTYDNIEYIVIDGGSTDGTLDVIKKYEKVLTYWLSEPDNGVYDAMNKGISMATGDVVGIINADDWLDANTITNVANAFREKNVEIIHGDLIYVNEAGKPYAKYAGSSNIDYLRYKMCIHHPTCFIKKSTYMQYGVFNLNYKLAADYELLLRFYLSGVKFYYLPENIAYFRLGGLSTTYKIKSLNEVRIISTLYGGEKSIIQRKYYTECIAGYIIAFLERYAPLVLTFYRRKKKNIQFIEKKV